MDTERIIPSRRELFDGFLLVGIQGFGGVLPWARRMMVDQRRWMDDREFTELLSLGQLLPGPNIVNVAVVVGSRYHGPAGSLIAVTGLLLAPLCAVLTLGILYEHYGYLDPLRHLLAGISAAAAGLVLGMGLKLAHKMDRRRWVYALAALTFVLIALWRLPLPIVLAVTVPVGIALGYRSVIRERKP